MALLIGAIAFAVMMTALLIGGLLDWGGVGAADEPNKYCERVRRDSMFRQPVNTWSDMAFVLAGLGILFFVSLQKKTGSPANPMAVSSLFSILFGCLVIWLGPGSMFLHASQKEWGGWVDNLSMNMFLTFFFCYDLMRLTGFKPLVFVLLYLGITLTFGLLTWFITWEHMGILTFVILITAVIASEIAVGYSDRISRDPIGLFAGIALFGTAFAVWVPSKTDGAFCTPDSFWQGHALWHVFSAAATPFFYAYLQSEIVR